MICFTWREGGYSEHPLNLLFRGWWWGGEEFHQSRTDKFDGE